MRNVKLKLDYFVQTMHSPSVKFQVLQLFVFYFLLNNAHGKNSTSSLAESTSINPKQCKKLN